MSEQNPFADLESTEDNGGRDQSGRSNPRRHRRREDDSESGYSSATILAFIVGGLIAAAAIVVVIASVFLMGGTQYTISVEDGKVRDAKAQIKQLEYVVRQFHADNERYPESLHELLVPDQDSGLPYIKDPNSIIDPWDQPYQYEYDKRGPYIWTQPSTGKIISNRE